MMERELARRGFQAIVERPDKEIDLALAALLIAQEEYPSLDSSRYLDILDDMAAAVENRLGSQKRRKEVIAAISGYLFSEMGFHGNKDHYYDPQNSFLNQVLDRRMGIPITLSMVYIEVAQRIGLPALGVGLPGHFIVKHPGAGGDIYVDPFNGGVIMSEEECKTLVESTEGGSLTFRREFLRPLSKKEILARMLNNLKRIYLESGDHLRALAVVERLLLISPDATQELRDRGLLHLNLQAFANAWKDLSTYEKLASGGDMKGIRQLLAALERMKSN